MGQGRGWASRSVLLLAAVCAAVAGCTGTPKPTPSPHRPAPHPTATATPAPSAITVIAPLGVNLRTAPSTTASVVGVVAQGVALPYVAHTSASGGWWQVRGSSQTGWITADSEYTSTLTFQTYSAAVGGGTPWSVMYPEGWTFAQESSGPVEFTGPNGTSITFTTSSTTAQLPSAASAGQVQSGVSSAVVYGVTAPLITYSNSTGKYQASIEFQAQPALAFLIQAQLAAKGGAATLNLFLETVFFTVPATPSP
ncbi:MAG: SH3 domain-containing protein [Candidatus Dormibacteria bacterium]